MSAAAGEPPGRALRDVGSALLAYLAMPVFGLLALSVLLGGFPADDAAELPMGPALAAQCAASLLVLFLAFRLGRPGPLGRGLVAAPLLYVAFLLVFVPVALILLPWVWQRLGLPLAPQDHLVWFLGERPLGYWVVGLLTVTLVGPIYEEVVFRGFLLRGLRSMLGDLGAVALSGFLFGLMHAGSGWFLVLPLTLLGGFLGWLRLRFEGLLAPCLVHVLHNTLVMGLALTVPELVGAVYGEGG